MATLSEHQELKHAYMKLKKQAEQLRRAKKLLEERNRVMMEELALASELQKSLLPRETPQELPLTISHRYIPYLSVGGDFFDYQQISPSKVGLIIADASGHGVASAFLTAMMKSAFNHLSSKTDSPAELLAGINEEFCRTIRTDHYITAFYGVIDTESLECVYANAGHPPQILMRRDGEIEELNTEGFFLGTFESTVYRESAFTLYPGDRLVLFTDGLLETVDTRLEAFGRERLLRILNETGETDLESMSNEVISELLAFLGGASFQDDITLLTAEMIESL